jgi:hypothetical protein
MQTIKEIEREIVELTFKIESEYPELYQFLNENPITIPSKNNPDINRNLLLDYLDSLKQQLKHHKEIHRIK